LNLEARAYAGEMLTQIVCAVHTLLLKCLSGWLTRRGREE
jgi:hypothetical protein